MDEDINYIPSILKENLKNRITRKEKVALVSIAIALWIACGIAFYINLK